MHNEKLAKIDKPLSVFFENAFPQYKFVADELIKEGNKVMVRERILGVTRRRNDGQCAAGKGNFSFIVLIFEIENNKILNHWMVADNFALIQQLGVIH